MLANQVSFFLSTLIFSLFTLSLSNPDFTTLLAFKSSSDISNSLISWSNSTQPCSGSWLGVTCNPSTHRVTRLVLDRLNLTGSTHPLTQLTHLRLLSLNHNNLSSSLNFTSWPNLKHLYLSHNHFTGIFPAGISHLLRLRRLDLSHNNLSGEIPMTELAELTHLITLRLEANLFTGSLSSSNSSSLSIPDFNVSDNNLAGVIPKWLSALPASSFEGNKNLCGRPLPNDCFNQTAVNEPEQITVSDGRRKKKKSDRMVLMIISIDVAAAIVVIGIVACSITCCCKKRRRSRRERKSEMKRYDYGLEREEDGELVCFEGCMGFDKVDELLKASAEMLGKGSVGTTYKVVMESGDVVVVKRVRESRRRKKEVDGFLRVIGGVRHCNIVSLRAYYYSPDELLLVYDFLPNGSLHYLLHGNRGPGRTPLDWTTRLKLAAGAAQGLAFLHSSDKSKLSHGHLTSSNIIIDHLGNACISDIGLHQLLPSQSSSNNAYKAPELILNNNNNNKQLQSGDVYSFGVILLEILTGKMVTGEGETSLVKWVQRVAREEWKWEVFDFELLRYKEMEGEMMALLNVALLCLNVVQSDRPKMNMVYKMIEDIRMKGSDGGRRDGGGIHSPLNHLSSGSSSSSSLAETTPNFTSN